MIKGTNRISEVKDMIAKLKEKEVQVTFNQGRNRYISYSGKLTGVYQALFTVTPLDDYKGNTTYSYADYMCGIVKLSLKEGETS